MSTLGFELRIVSIMCRVLALFPRLLSNHLWNVMHFNLSFWLWCLRIICYTPMLRSDWVAFFPLLHSLRPRSIPHKSRLHFGWDPLPLWKVEYASALEYNDAFVGKLREPWSPIRGQHTLHMPWSKVALAPIAIRVEKTFFVVVAIKEFVASLAKIALISLLG
jgi:hypothetical protein